MAYEILFFGHPELYENNEGTARLLRGRWRTVIVPSVDVLSDAQIKLLSAFVRRGGVIKSVAIQTGATEIRKWMTRLVVASGTTGVNLSAIAPLLQQSERVLTPLAPASHSLGATAGKLQDVVSELQRAVGCITAGAKQWQAQERQAVLDLHPDWS
eukprot:SAG25_NODE_7120_length_503_cov_0.995050_1_plen_155_part_10